MGREQVVVGLAAQLVPCEADLVLIILIRVDEAAIEVLAKNVERQALHERPVAGLGMSQFVVGSLATDRIAHGMLKDAGLEIVLDQDNPDALGDGAGTNGFLCQIAQEDHRHIGSDLSDSTDCRIGVAVQSGHVDQDCVDAAPLEAGQTVRQGVREFDRKSDPFGTAQRSEIRRASSESLSISRILTEGSFIDRAAGRYLRV